MRARYYSPDLRRFVNADILRGGITDSTSLNRYAYVNGNPITFVDPLGLSRDRGTQSSTNQSTASNNNNLFRNQNFGRHSNYVNFSKTLPPYTADDPEFKSWLQSEAEKYHSRYKFVSADKVSVVQNEKTWIDDYGAIYVVDYSLEVVGHAEVFLNAGDGMWIHTEFTASDKDKDLARIKINPNYNSERVIDYLFEES